MSEATKNSMTRQRILKWATTRDDAFTPFEAANHLEVPIGTVRNYVSQMAQDGELVRVARGWYVVASADVSGAA